MITGLLPVMENGGQENISRLQRKTVPPTHSLVLALFPKGKRTSASLVRMLLKREPWRQFLVRLNNASGKMATSYSVPSETSLYNFSGRDNLAR
jgi:hypothetical protein